MPHQSSRRLDANIKNAQRSVKARDDRPVPLGRYRHGHREEFTRRQRNFVIDDAADNASHAARRVARHGVRSHPVPPSRSWASAPSQSCRTSRASRARRTASIASRSSSGASRPRRGRCRTRSRARTAGRAARGRTRAWSTQRSRQQHAGAGRRWSSTGYSITWHLRSTEVNSVRPKRPGPATSCAPSASSGSERSPTSCA
jgi:hypothetical protein